VVSYFFADDLVALIDEWVHENAVTPAVAQQKIQALLKQRQDYVNRITELHYSLEAIGIEAVELKECEAEIGFLLPRSLFNNDFEKLISELEELDFILRAFSELALGIVETIQVSSNFDI
jgi:hypothetical protein